MQTLISFLPQIGGGLLIGLSALMLMVLNGRIAGISGILSGLLRPAGGDIGWRIAFVAGILVAPLLAAWGTGALPTPTVTAPPWLLVLAGLLVGIGTAIGSGCTSGHGVCGLARLSTRSLVAVGLFMGAALLTVTLTRHVWGA